KLSSFQKLELRVMFFQGMKTLYLSVCTCSPEHAPVVTGVKCKNVQMFWLLQLELECTWTGDQNQLPNMIGLWRKDGHDVENSRLTVHLENEQYHLKRAFNIVNEEDFGNYSCMFGSDAKIDFVLTAPQMIEARDKPIIGYVGDSVVIACKMGETKPKPSTWIWYKANGTDKEQIVAAAEPHRYEIKNKERETKLLVHNLTEADSGSYFCDAVYPIIAVTCSLKVITFHEPLKPFIAIAVEVTFLVAAILLYEKIWSKKDSAAGSWTANDVLYVNMLWDILSFDLNYLPYIQETGQMTNLTQCEYYREGFLHLSLAFAVFHDVHFCALIRTLGENCGSEGGSSMRQRKV
uniref:Ig-like domain-containing protein n=1 Tax=Mola mola TaxID=94237 RepID=A0A3Q3WYK0_MOLML